MRDAEKARDTIAGGQFKDRIRLVAGDITKADLGLGADAESIQKDTVEVFHLAAVYDLAVKREFAVRVNIDGTKHVLNFCKKCPSLRRHQYVSTCYVSGRYDGVFHEEDLEKNQTFNNFYEETKHYAEVEVRKTRDQIPTTIFRPSIVVGDSETGATQKYDGPYFAIRYVLRQKTPVVVMPLVGEPAKNEMNIVPRDFVVDALTHLSGLIKTTGKTYALATPTPPTIRELIDTIEHASGKRLIKIPLPLGVAKAAIDKVPGVEKFFGFPSDAVDYFVHPARYNMDNTLTAIEGTDLLVPRFQDYLPRMVDYVRRYPKVPSAAMV